MEQYIPKSAVVAEIRRLKVHSEEALQEFGREGYIDNVLFEQSKIRICEILLSFLNTLEVKEVDLDFTKEVDVWVRDNGDTNGFFNVQDLAKHFFELGIKVVQKGKQYDMEQSIEQTR